MRLFPLYHYTIPPMSSFCWRLSAFHTDIEQTSRKYHHSTGLPSSIQPRKTKWRKRNKKDMLGKSSVCFSFLCLKVFSWCAAMMTCNVSCLMKRFNQAYWTIKLIFVAWGGWSVIFVLIGLLLQYCPILDTPNHKILFRLDKN